MQKFIMVIFGASGDLTKRKLMPALFELYKAQRMPAQFSLVGVGRTHYTTDSYRSYIRKEMTTFVDMDQEDALLADDFCKHLSYLAIDPSKQEDYDLLVKHIDEETGCDKADNLLFYLATPPSLYGVIPLHLKAKGLNRPGARIIVEKPFGYDLQSAQELNRIYASVFEEKQIYRIDHFLGKETAQNILAFRFSNSIFEPIWNRNYIDYVEITAVENLGIEGRGGFYEGTGALRDMVQNHLVQLVALTAMEPPSVFNADNFRNEVVKVYESLIPLTKEDFNTHIIRGQYVGNRDKKGYREEKGVSPNSRTETYVAMKLGIENWRWSGVPFYIRTGKQMPTKVTEIVVHFKKAPYQLFSKDSGQMVDNRLILRLQPNEGIVLKFGMKTPGSGFQVKQVSMDFCYSDLGSIQVGDAYARLIDDCIQGDQTLYTRSDAVEASWRFFDPILTYWKENENVPLYGYPAGTWGPRESDRLMKEHGADWTNPCKNLTHTDEYCEL